MNLTWIPYGLIMNKATTHDTTHKHAPDIIWLTAVGGLIISFVRSPSGRSVLYWGARRCLSWTQLIPEVTARKAADRGPLLIYRTLVKSRKKSKQRGPEDTGFNLWFFSENYRLLNPVSPFLKNVQCYRSGFQIMCNIQPWSPGELGTWPVIDKLSSAHPLPKTRL